MHIFELLSSKAGSNGKLDWIVLFRADGKSRDRQNSRLKVLQISFYNSEAAARIGPDLESCLSLKK